MATKKVAAKKPANKGATKASEKTGAAASASASAPFLATAKKGAVEIGPDPLVAHQEITITATGLPPLSTVRFLIDPEGTRTRIPELRTDPFGQAQTAIIPVAGPHRVTIEWKGGKVTRDFDVAEQ
jgi:hypothetical protein